MNFRRSAMVWFLVVLPVCLPSSAVAAKKAKGKATSADAKAEKPAEPEEPDVPATVPRPLYCPIPDETPPGAPFVVRCLTRPSVGATSLAFFYRAAGAETFTPLPMPRSPKGWYTATVPPEVLSGTSLQYYVEAKDATDKLAARSGRFDSPNTLMIREGAATVSQGLFSGLARKRGPLVFAHEDDPFAVAERERQREKRRGVKSWWFGFGLGTGFGWHPTHALEFRTSQDAAAGFSRAGTVHFSPEVGYQVNDRLAVSLQGRNQFFPVEGSGDPLPGSPASSAHAVLARASYVVRDMGQAQFVATATLGGGQGFRLNVPPEYRVLPRSDTVRGGPLVGGAGAGFRYQFNKNIAYTAEARLLAGAPDFALVVDLTTGAEFGF